jgi:hypothetical protein
MGPVTSPDGAGNEPRVNTECRVQNTDIEGSPNRQLPTVGCGVNDLDIVLNKLLPTFPAGAKVQDAYLFSGVRYKGKMKLIYLLITATARFSVVTSRGRCVPGRRECRKESWPSLGPFA